MQVAAPACTVPNASPPTIDEATATEPLSPAHWCACEEHGSISHSLQFVKLAAVDM